jgi:hypothetical protein
MGCAAIGALPQAAIRTIFVTVADSKGSLSPD